MYDAPLKVLLKATGRDLTFALPVEVESRHIAVMTDAHHPLILRCNGVAVPNYKTAGGAWADHLVFEGLAVLPDFAGDSRIKSVLQWQGAGHVICGWFVDVSPIRSLMIQSPTNVTMAVCAVMIPKVDDLTGDWRLGDDDDLTIVGYAKGGTNDAPG